MTNTGHPFAARGAATNFDFLNEIAVGSCLPCSLISWDPVVNPLCLKLRTATNSVSQQRFKALHESCKQLQSGIQLLPCSSISEQELAAFLFHRWCNCLIPLEGLGLISEGLDSAHQGCLWPLTGLMLQRQTWLIIRLLKKISKPGCLDYLQPLPALTWQSLVERDVEGFQLPKQTHIAISSLWDSSLGRAF